jgi:ABC-type dipeptide/oligopeptide/nickel transport system permease subunit
MRGVAWSGWLAALIVVALALIGPLLAGDPLAQHDLLQGALLPPSARHWLGTDQHARDVFARLAHGARLSLLVAAIAVTVSTTLGLAIGLAAGSARGVIGGALSRLVDLALALPRVVVLLLVVAAVGVLPAPLLGLALGATGWPGVARLVRGEALRIREQEFVTAARALGASPARIVRREILPGTIPVALVAATLGVADVLLLEAGLSFLGLGIRPPTPTWGGMILEAREFLGQAPWLLLAPGAALVLATAAATLLGDALRRRLGIGPR